MIGGETKTEKERERDGEIEQEPSLHCVVTGADSPSSYCMQHNSGHICGLVAIYMELQCQTEVSLDKTYDKT